MPLEAALSADGPRSVYQLAVVIVNWNTAALLRECLQSLRTGRTELRLEIIVIDNASTDDSQTMVRGEFPEVELIANPTNAGYTRANNQGITASHAPLVMLLNSDTRVPAGTLPTLVEFMATHPEAGAIGPQLVRPDGSLQPFGFGGDPTIGYLLARGFNRLWRRRYLHNWATAGAQTVDWVSGACLLARRTAIAQAGLLDEHIFMYFEDADWCLRLRRAGWKVYVVPQASVVHLGGQSMVANLAARDAYRESLRYFYRKHYSPAAQWLLRCLLPIYQRLVS